MAVAKYQRPSDDQHRPADEGGAAQPKAIRVHDILAGRSGSRDVRFNDVVFFGLGQAMGLVVFLFALVLLSLCGNLFFGGPVDSASETTSQE